MREELQQIRAQVGKPSKRTEVRADSVTHTVCGAVVQQTEGLAVRLAQVIKQDLAPIEGLISKAVDSLAKGEG